MDSAHSGQTVQGERRGIKPMMTGAEVAELLRVSRATIYRLAAPGELPAQKVGNAWRFPRDAIKELAVRTSTSTGGSVPRALESVLADAKE